MTTEDTKIIEGKKNHREIARDLKLFFFDDMSVGSCFFLPDGAYIYKKLVDFMREQYRILGYDEVITPIICDKKLWIQSGHWDKYKENMFILNKNHDDNDAEFALSSMNCPKHCVMFKHMNPSYKDLPIRLADFGALHRNELSGTLNGGFRARKFSQDDSHTFAKMDQIDDEIRGILILLRKVYEMFGFKYSVEVSTRPEKYIGSNEIWQRAETILMKHASEFGDINVDVGGGAFYGPKIDVKIKDSLGRDFQCATIQLDFNLPERFDLTYATSDQKSERPVMIHKAIFGSVERFMAILLEHTQGYLPFWLSPRQIMIIPIKTNLHTEYTNKVRNLLSKYRVQIDESGDTLNKKIFNAEIMKYNFIAVVGAQEVARNTIALRFWKDGKSIVEKMKLDELIGYIEKVDVY